ncbi:P1 family peptidase [candidate division KSB1 bacterium]|nr:P1 family peptidase [candidate division KSB1 bacterium]
MHAVTLHNSITDVRGVHLGHLTVAESDVQTGLTVILPYPLTQRDRKLFLGSFAVGNWNEWTGLHVAQDFGTFSSPIVLCNATTVGIAYDALITFGHQRDAGLPIDNAWPPIVIGLDDGYLNDLRQRRIAHDDVLQVLHEAKSIPRHCGSVGIGRGLCAFGGKGGVGEASCLATVANERYTVGAVLVANGGRLRNYATSTAFSLTPSLVLIIATDAPLLPESLRRLAETAMAGLSQFGLAESGAQQLALAFSTSNTIDHAFEDRFQLFHERWLSHEQLGPLFHAGAETSREALRRSLQHAEAVTGRKGRTLKPVDWQQLLESQK